jgi:hypothetical protein
LPQFSFESDRQGNHGNQVWLRFLSGRSYSGHVALDQVLAQHPRLRLVSHGFVSASCVWRRTDLKVSKREPMIHPISVH